MTTRAKRSAKSPRIEALVRDDRELLKTLMQESLQAVLDAEMTETVGAGPGERTVDRTGYRSGYYSRGLVTRIGKLELRVPRDREGRSLRLLQPRAGDPDREAGAAGAAGPGGPLLDRAV